MGAAVIGVFGIVGIDGLMLVPAVGPRVAFAGEATGGSPMACFSLAEVLARLASLRSIYSPGTDLAGQPWGRHGGILRYGRNGKEPLS